MFKATAVCPQPAENKDISLAAGAAPDWEAAGPLPHQPLGKGNRQP